MLLRVCYIPICSLIYYWQSRMMFYLFSLNLFRNKNANLIFRISNVNLRSAYPQLSISLYVLFCRTFRISRRLLYSFMIALIYNIRIMWNGKRSFLRKFSLILNAMLNCIYFRWSVCIMQNVKFCRKAVCIIQRLNCL